MKVKDLSSWNKAFYLASWYYFILAILSLIQLLVMLYNNLFSADPALSILDYILHFAWLVFFTFLIQSNYQIIFKEPGKKNIVINLIFSALQIISFNIYHIIYFTNFGINLSFLFGLKNSIEFQIVHSFSKIQYAFMYDEKTNLQFISISLVSLLFFIIFLNRLKAISQNQLEK